MTWFERYGLICIVIVLSTLFVGAGFYSYSIVSQSHVQEIHDELDEALTNRYGMLRTRIDYGRREVKFLANTPPNSGIIRAIDNQGFDSVDNTSLQQWRDRLATIYTSYLLEHNDIIQIRYLLVNERFEELVRVDRVANGVRRVPEDKLQTKRGRDYIIHTMDLEPQSTYVSDINLNREFGRLAEPLQPTYRISQLLFDDKELPRAIVVINYDAGALLHELATDMPSNTGLYAVGGEGQFIIHPDARWLFANEYSAAFTPAQQQVVNTGETFLGLPLYRDKLSAMNVLLKTQLLDIGNTAHPSHITLMSYMKQSDVHTLIEKEWHVWLGALILLYFIMLIVLVTYHHLASRQLKMSHEISEFKAIIQSMDMPVFGLDGDLMVRSFNTAARRFFNVPDVEVIGQKYSAVLKIPNKEAKQIAKSAKQAQYLSMEIELDDAQGDVRQVQFNVVPVKDEHQGKRGTALILNDRTQEWQLREQLQDINNSLEKKVLARTKQLELARQEAEKANEAKSLFVANMSHELRTPMNGVFGMLNLIKKEPLSEQQQHYLHLAQTSASNLTSLINSVLDISKIEAGKMELEVHPVNIEVVLNELIQSNSIRPLEKGVFLLLDTSELKHKYFSGDITRIRQIFTNLLSNSIKFTESGYVCVTVAAKYEQGMCRLDFCVEDSGVGIEPGKIGDLFQSFTQADNSITRKYGGTGLGLAITKQLVELMGGEIHVESKPAHGSRFFGHIMLHSLERDEPIKRLLQDNTAVIFDDLPKRKEVVSHVLQSWGADVKSTDWESLPALIERNEQRDGPLYVFVAINKDITQTHTQLKRIFKHTHEDALRVVMMTGVQSDSEFVDSFDNVQSIGSPISSMLIAHILFDETDEYSQVCESGTPSRYDFESVSGSRILIVDDNAINQAVVKGVFKDLPLALKTCTDGQQALDILAKDRDIDVVLMDCQMPVLDGYSASSAIRRGEASDVHTSVPIVAMTANAMAGDRERCLQAGMSDYITKPIDAEHLLEKTYYWLSVARVKKRSSLKLKG
ncbi:ATP-binding protein [Pseudoalteromonas sp. GB56]